MLPLYLFHPMAVHFPIALLTIGFCAAAAALIFKNRAWLGEEASWLLWLGTLSAWAAMGLGLIAERSAPHVPEAWQTMYQHKHLAFWTVGLFTALCLWRKFAAKRWDKVFLLFWFGAILVLLATAYKGGELVFMYGVGGPQTQ